MKEQLDDSALKKGIIPNLKYDLPAGLVVFFVALPLCMGIAMASGAPVLAGLITGIVGGIIVSFASGSKLSVSGPAAGLSVIVLGAISELGAYPTFLMAVVLAGLMQIILGFIRAGVVVYYIPPAVVEGMLAAIGLLLIKKQLPKAFGFSEKTIKEMSEFSIGSDGFMELIGQFAPGAIIIGLISLVVLIIWDTKFFKQNKILKLIPGGLVVVILGVIINAIYHAYNPGMVLDSSYLVTLPVFNNPQEISQALQFPDFSQITNPAVYTTAITFTIIASLETLSSLKAVDLIDPFKRISPTNRELKAQGLGNMISGLIGGIPMTSVIVRSSANVSSGGRTHMAAFFHGLFLLLSILFIPGLLNMIPIASLAALLVYIGYKLASPKKFGFVYRIGKEQLFIFVVTIIVTLAEDLLLGIAAGIITKVILHLISGTSITNLFKIKVQVDQDKDTYHIHILNNALFSNYLGFKKHLNKIPAGKKVTIDFKKSLLVDHAFMDQIHHFEHDYNLTGGHVQIIGLDKHTASSKHPLSSRKLKKNAGTKTLQLSPRQKSLQEVANKFSFSFAPQPATNISKFNSFPYVNGSRIRYEENAITGEIHSYPFSVADILIEEGAGLTKKEYTISQMLIVDSKNQIPVFTLEREGFFDQLVDVGFKDIDFEEYPVFSKHYLLKGPNEEAIRAFMKKELIEYFEKNKGYHVECKNGMILIYKDKKMVSPTEVEQMIEFGKNMLNFI